MHPFSNNSKNSWNCGNNIVSWFVKMRPHPADEVPGHEESVSELSDGPVRKYPSDTNHLTNWSLGLGSNETFYFWFLLKTRLGSLYWLPRGVLAVSLDGGGGGGGVRRSFILRTQKNTWAWNFTPKKIPGIKFSTQKKYKTLHLNTALFNQTVIIPEKNMWQIFWPKKYWGCKFSTLKIRRTSPSWDWIYTKSICKIICFMKRKSYW